MSLSPSRVDIGKKGEEIAFSFLRRKGYRVVDRNWRCKMGEIDIIAMDGETLVFVEVRSLKMHRNLRTPEESVTIAKKKRLLNAARVYLGKNGLWHRKVRFDIIGVMFEKQGHRISHEQDIFWESEVVSGGDAYWQPW